MVLFFQFKHASDDRRAAGTYITHIPKNDCVDRDEHYGPQRRVNYDPRFPNQNKTRYCRQMYLDWHRCTKKHGEGYEICQYFKTHYENLCPVSWVEKWDAQIEEGTFPQPI